MPGYLVEVGATMKCGHGGQATLAAPNPRVKTAGQMTGVLTTQVAVSGCPNPAQSGGPCVQATWLTGALRVKSNGAAVIISSSTGQCKPTPAPLLIAETQLRVKAQ